MGYKNMFDPDQPENLYNDEPVEKKIQPIFDENKDQDVLDAIDELNATSEQMTHIKAALFSTYKKDHRKGLINQLKAASGNFNSNDFESQRSEQLLNLGLHCLKKPKSCNHQRSHIQDTVRCLLGLKSISSLKPINGDQSNNVTVIVSAVQQWCKAPNIDQRRELNFNILHQYTNIRNELIRQGNSKKEMHKQKAAVLQAAREVLTASTQGDMNNAMKQLEKTMLDNPLYKKGWFSRTSKVIAEVQKFIRDNSQNITIRDKGIMTRGPR